MSKVIFVTGANAGIGRAIVQGLLETDPTITVIIGSLASNDGEEAVAELKKTGYQGVSCLQVDITSDESIASAVKAIQDTHGKLDVLINNAGIASPPGSEREQFAAIYHVNVISTNAMMHAFLPLLQKSTNPRIVNISSGTGSIGSHVAGVLPPNMYIPVPYAASKAALNMVGVLFQKAHPEVEVHAVNPGPCKTALSMWNGLREPSEGARVAVVITLAEKGVYKGMGFWVTVGDSMVPTPLPW